MSHILLVTSSPWGSEGLSTRYAMLAAPRVARARVRRASPHLDDFMPELKTNATLGICTERACPLTTHPDSVEATR